MLERTSKLKVVINWLLMLLILLIPWQARIILDPGIMRGQFWEYTTVSFYATEALLWLIVVLSAIDLFRDTEFQKKLKSREHFHKHWPRLVFIGVVFLLFIISIAHSASPNVSYYFIIRLLGILCLFLVLAASYNLPTTSLYLAFWFSGVVQGIIALVQFFAQRVVHLPLSGMANQLPSTLGAFVVEAGGERWLRAYGSFGSPDLLGGFLAICFVLGIYLYLHAKPKQQIFITLGQLFILIGLIFSFSRGAWIAAAIGVIIFLFVILGEAKNLPLGNNHQMFRMTKQLIFSLAIIITVIVLFPQLFSTRLTAAGRLEAKSLDDRAAQYHLVLSYLVSPIGVGPGVYTLSLEKNNPTLPFSLLQPVHNTYLLLLAELGIAGFVLFLITFFYIVRQIYFFNRLYLGVVVTLFTLGLFDHSYWTLYAGQLIWWVVLALGTNKKPDVIAGSKQV